MWQLKNKPFFRWLFLFFEKKTVQRYDLKRENLNLQEYGHGLFGFDAQNGNNT